MRLVVLNNKIVGEKLEMPIFSSEGVNILSKGAVLTERIISKLKELGVGTVYISDDRYDDVVLQELVDESHRIKALKQLRDIFEHVKKKHEIDPYAVKDIVKDILDNINVSENSIILSNNFGTDKSDICTHSLNVMLISVLIGISRSYNYNQLIDLAVGALLHDIGKLLGDEKLHPDLGFKFLRDIKEFSTTSNICAYSHHEHVDGTGYPRKVEGDQIYEYAKIVSLCNEYENLNATSGQLPHKVLERISADVGRKFDIDVYNDFIKVIHCYPNGLSVKLNNGVEGVVVMQNKSFPQRPIIKARRMDKTEYINLMEKLNLFVEDVII